MFRFCKEHWFFLVAACDMKHECALKFWEDMFILCGWKDLPCQVDWKSDHLCCHLKRRTSDAGNLIGENWFHHISTFLAPSEVVAFCSRFALRCAIVEELRRRRVALSCELRKAASFWNKFLLVQNSASQHFKGKLLYFHPVGRLSHFVNINSMSIEARNKIYSGEPLVTLGQIAVSCKWLK